jgi:hypothetical protein
MSANKIDDGGPVHPVRIPTGGTHRNDEPEPTSLHTGMSLRDYFAAKVIPAIYGDSLGGPDWRDDVANQAYQLADAMLKAREKGGTQ